MAAFGLPFGFTLYSDYAQALGNHASMETTEDYVKADEVNPVEPLF